MTYQHQELENRVIVDHLKTMATRYGFELHEHKADADTTEKARRFKVIDPETYSQRPDMDWLVYGVLPRAELAVMFGESGSGKSFLAYDLAASITRGIAWNGRTVEQGKVVYVAAEGSGGMKNRQRAYMEEHGVGFADVPAFIPAAPNLLEAADTKELIHELLDYGRLSLVVVDTLASVTPGGNENSSEMMGLAIAACRRIHKATGATCLLVHHAGKNISAGARGHSSLKAATDAEIEVIRDGDNREWRVSKMKEDEDNIRDGFKLKRIGLGVDKHGDPRSSCVVVPCELRHERGTDARPRGDYEIAVMDYFNANAWLSEGDVETSAIVSAIKANTPKPEGKDNRASNINRAVASVCKKKLLEVVPESDQQRVRKVIRETHQEFMQ